MQRSSTTIVIARRPLRSQRPPESRKALDAPEAGPVLISSQLKYRTRRSLLVFFGSHRPFSEPRISILRENRARRLLRGGEGGGSARCVRCELDVTQHSAAAASRDMRGGEPLALGDPGSDYFSDYFSTRVDTNLVESD